MAKVSSSFAIFLLLLLINGMISTISGVEAIRHKHRKRAKNMAMQQLKVNCSSNDFCDPFAAKIDLRCKDSDECLGRCNIFGGIFLCSGQRGYCICEMET